MHDFVIWRHLILGRRQSRLGQISQYPLVLESTLLVGGGLDLKRSPPTTHTSSAYSTETSGHLPRGRTVPTSHRRLSVLTPPGWSVPYLPGRECERDEVISQRASGTVTLMERCISLSRKEKRVVVGRGATISWLLQLLVTFTQVNNHLTSSNSQSSDRFCWCCSLLFPLFFFLVFPALASLGLCIMYIHISRRYVSTAFPSPSPWGRVGGGWVVGCFNVFALESCRLPGFVWGASRDSEPRLPNVYLLQ